MSVTFFIPAVSFSDVIISWNNISLLNYIRGFVFLIGSLYLPGACIYDRFFSKINNLNIDPLIMKITFYPVISLIFLAILTTILEFMNLTREIIIIILLFSLFVVYFVDLSHTYRQKSIKKHQTSLKFKMTNIKISKNTIILLLIGFGCIMIAFGQIFTVHQYLLAGDRWRGIAFATTIGDPNIRTFELSYTYTKYWSCFSFSLSVLTGLPYINLNVLLSLFIYLPVTSMYILLKNLLKGNLDEKVIILSSIFSSIFFNITLLVYQFSYHTFAFITLFLSIAVFSNAIRLYKMPNSEKLIKIPMSKEESYQESNLKNLLEIFGTIGETFEQKEKIKEDMISKSIKISLFLSALFFMQGLMLYFIPALFGSIIIIIYCVFSTKLKRSFKIFLRFYLCFIVIFVVFDLLTFFYFSYWIVNELSNFSGINLLISNSDRALSIIFSSLIFYLISSIIVILLLITNKIFSRNLPNLFGNYLLKGKTYLEKRYKFLFLTIFSGLFIFLLAAIINLNFFDRILRIDSLNGHTSFYIFYIDLLVGTLGILGIIGLLFSYFTFKENKNLFFFLLFWTFICLGVASSLIFLRWIQYPNLIVSDLPEGYYGKLIHFFTRSWYYTTIPLSIFLSVGLIKLITRERSYRWKRKKKLRHYYYKIIRSNCFKTIRSFTLISTIIICTFTAPLSEVIYWNNYTPINRYDAATADLIGWTTKNIPRDSNLLIDSTYWWLKARFEEDLFMYKTFYFRSEFSQAFYNYTLLIERLNDFSINYFIMDKRVITEEQLTLVWILNNSKILYENPNFLLYQFVC